MGSQKTSNAERCSDRHHIVPPTAAQSARSATETASPMRFRGRITCGAAKATEMGTAASDIVSGSVPVTEGTICSVCGQ